MGKRTGKPMGRPSKGMTMSKHNIELAIKSTQSMGQAGLYMGVSKNTFKNMPRYTDYGHRLSPQRVNNKQEMLVRL